MSPIPASILAFFTVLALSSCADKMDYFPDLNGDAKTVAPSSLFPSPSPSPSPAPSPAVASPRKNDIDLKSGPRVRVKPVDGVSAPMARLLARSVVKNLLELRVSAITDDAADSDAGGKNDYVLSGKAEANWKDQRAPFTAIIRWTLVDSAGKPAAAFIYGVRANWWQWQNGAPQVIRMVGLSAAKPIADLLAVRLEPPTPQELMDTTLIVRSVRGASGDGNQALMRAVTKALRASDVSVTEDPRQAAFVLDGVVAVSPIDKNMEKIVIEWTVKTINGREVGKSSRRITVPGGSVDFAWGRIALQSGIDVVADIEEIITGTSLSGRLVSRPGRSSTPSVLPSFKRRAIRRVPGRALPPPP